MLCNHSFGSVHTGDCTNTIQLSPTGLTTIRRAEFQNFMIECLPTLWHGRIMWAQWTGELQAGDRTVLPNNLRQVQEKWWSTPSYGEGGVGLHHNMVKEVLVYTIIWCRRSGGLHHHMVQEVLGYTIIWCRRSVGPHHHMVKEVLSTHVHGEAAKSLSPSRTSLKCPLTASSM